MGAHGVRPELHVLILIDHLVLGGAEMLVSQFVKAAPTQDIRVEVTCLAELDGNPAAEPLRRIGIEPHNLDLYGRPGMRPLLEVRRHLRERSPDVVHSHLGDADLLGALAARSLGLPMISTIHTAAWGDDLQTTARRRLIRLCAARVIAVSNEAAHVYSSRGWARSGQLVTIYNGVDAAPAPGEGAALRAEFGWTRDDLVVGMVSALRPLKSHDLAIEALGLLKDEFPTLRLLIVGQGDAWDDIARLAGRYPDRVALAGRREDVMRCFDAFDICLHPSRVEAFPTTLIEAMAAAVPVVATRVGGIPEIIEDGRTGLLVPVPASAESLAAALAPLLRDAALRQQMGAAGRSDYEQRFTAGPWIRKTRTLYDEVLAESGSRAASREGN